MTQRKIALCTLLVTTMLGSAALAQQPVMSNRKADSAAVSSPDMSHAGKWRASKLMGLNLYNPQNEKVGEINEMILDNKGAVVGVIVGVGGFLGMGERNILIGLDQVTFMNEPVKSTATSSTTSTSATTPSSSISATTPSTTGSTPRSPAAADSSTGTLDSQSTRAADAEKRWAPDHGVINATKDQLKSMPEFKYSS